MLVPNVTKVEYEVADIAADDFVSLIQEDGTLKEDLKLPTEEAENAELRKCWEDNHEKGQVFFTVVSAVGQHKITQGRVKDI